MALDPRIPLQAYRREPQRNLLADTAQVMQLRGMMDQQRQQAQMREALSGAVTPEGIDYEVAERALAQAGDVGGAMGIRKRIQEMETEGVKLGVAKLDRLGKLADTTARYLSAANPSNWPQVRQQAAHASQAAGMDPSSIPEQFDPDWVQRALSGTLSYKDQIQLEMNRLRAGETARHNRAMEGREPLVQVQDPETGGARYVPRSQAVGMAPPERQGMRVKVGDTEVTFGGSGDLSGGTRKDLEGELLKGTNALARTLDIARQFRPEWQEIPTRLGVAWDRLRDAWDSGSLDGNEKTRLQDYTQFRSSAGRNFALILNELSGAAVTDGEAERQRVHLPDTGTGVFDGDSPTELARKVENNLRFQQNAIARLRYIQRHGLTMEQVPLEDMPRIINEAARARRDQYATQGVPLSEAEEQATREVAQEFGIPYGY